MLPSDLLSLLIAFAYVAIVIAIAEILRRVFDLPVEFTRKFVHVGVGMSALAVTTLFRAWYIAIIGPLVFILLNYLSYRYQIFRGIERGQVANHRAAGTRTDLKPTTPVMIGEGQLGTLYFPLAFTILIPLLWSQPAFLAASLMPLTWGDSFAAILGIRFGAHRFTIFDQTSSVEGSLAMFVFSFVATFAALIVFGMAAELSLGLALGTSIVATIVEAFSPWGLDNLTVPIASAIVLVALSGLK